MGTGSLASLESQASRCRNLNQAGVCLAQRLAAHLHALTKQVEDLARLSFKNKPVYIAVDEANTTATREGLEQVRRQGGKGRL